MPERVSDQATLCCYTGIHSIHTYHLHCQPTTVLGPTIISHWANYTFGLGLCDRPSLSEYMRFTVLVVSTSVAHTQQLQHITNMQMMLCTFSLTAVLNSLNTIMEALITYKHVKWHSCSHRGVQLTLGWCYTPTPIAVFHRLESNGEAGYPSEDDTNFPSHSLGSTELFWATLFSSLAANKRRLSGYLSPRPAFIWTDICLMKQLLQIIILFCVQNSLWKQQEKNNMQCFWVDFS